MPRERITRRQKNISRLIRERKQNFKEKLKTFKKNSFFAVICVMLVWCASAYALSGEGRVSNDDNGSFLALRIPLGKSYDYDDILVRRTIDGDTIELENGERVRLIGIDTPESRYSAKLTRDARRTHAAYTTIIAMGKEASRFTASLVQGARVRIEFDVQRRDHYNRLLGYVYLPDGRMLNAVLVREGYAQVYTVPPNVKHVDTFLALQKEARENKRGFWKTNDTTQGKEEVR